MDWNDCNNLCFIFLWAVSGLFWSIYNKLLVMSKYWSPKSNNCSKNVFGCYNPSLNMFEVLGANIGLKWLKLPYQMHVPILVYKPVQQWWSVTSILCSMIVWMTLNFTMMYINVNQVQLQNINTHGAVFGWKWLKMLKIIKMIKKIQNLLQIYWNFTDSSSNLLSAPL